MFSSVDGVPYVKVGADAPRPFSFVGLAIETISVNKSADYTQSISIPQNCKQCMIMLYAYGGTASQAQSRVSEATISGGTIKSDNTRTIAGTQNGYMRTLSIDVSSDNILVFCPKVGTVTLYELSVITY